MEIKYGNDKSDKLKKINNEKQTKKPEINMMQQTQYVMSEQAYFYTFLKG